MKYVKLLGMIIVVSIIGYGLTGYFDEPTVGWVAGLWFFLGQMFSMFMDKLGITE